MVRKPFLINTDRADNEGEFDEVIRGNATEKVVEWVNSLVIKRKKVK